MSYVIVAILACVLRKLVRLQRTVDDLHFNRWRTAYSVCVFHAGIRDVRHTAHFTTRFRARLWAWAVMRLIGDEYRHDIRFHTYNPGEAGTKMNGPFLRSSMSYAVRFLRTQAAEGLRAADFTSSQRGLITPSHSTSSLRSTSRRGFR